jgi:hypothetical protein
MQPQQPPPFRPAHPPPYPPRFRPSHPGSPGSGGSDPARQRRRRIVVGTVVVTVLVAIGTAAVWLAASTANRAP